MTDRPDTATQRGRRHLRALVGESLREQRAAVALAIAGLTGVVAMDVLAPWPLKVIFDHLLLAQPLPPRLAWLQPLLDLGAWPALAVCAGAIAAVALAAGALAYLQLYNSARVGHRITWRLRVALFAHLQRLSLTQHRASHSGEIITKVAGDTHQLRDLYADGALTVARHGLTVAAMLGVMLWLHPVLAGLVVATLPPLLGLIFWLNRRVKASVRAQRRHEGRLTSRLNEMLGAIALVQAFGRHDDEEARFRREIEANYDSGLRSTRSAGAIGRAIAVAGAAGTAITVLLGAREVLAARLTPGELLVFMSYVTGLYKPMRDLGRLAGKFSRAGVSAQRVAEVLALQPDSADAPDAMVLTHCAGEIVFEGVSFAYPGAAPVLEGLDLRIAAGERVALVGPSGAGKSTLVNLLLRLVEPTAGRILIDGVDIRRYTRSSLRAQFGTVLQEPLLFAVSVRENIAYGRPDAPDAAVEAAARAARAHEFIVDLPQGYDTVLGEHAATLSGGQRQRLCLARALIKQPAVLLMDEPTAALDPRTAHQVHEAVARVHRDRTLLVIAHDLADMARYDRVLVLQAGRLVEQGPHDTLMRQRGAYLALVERRHG